MRTLLLASNEPHSDRFMQLCHELCISCPDKSLQVIGALHLWYHFWAADDRLDSGVWPSGMSLNKFGLWAKWPDPPAFGKALLAAGYIQQMRDVYPDEISGGPDSQGFVVSNPLGAGIYLDESFKSIHRRRSNASDLVVYLCVPSQRAYWAAKLHVDVALLEKQNRIPNGWLSADYGGDDNSEPTDPSLPGPEQPGCRVRNHQPSRHANRVPAIALPSKPNSGQKGQRRTSGAPPTEALRDYIRENKYSNPRLCLLSLDDNRSSRRIWNQALHNNPKAVEEILGDLVATDDDWNKIRNPAAVVMSHLRDKGIIE